MSVLFVFLVVAFATVAVCRKSNYTRCAQDPKCREGPSSAHVLDGMTEVMRLIAKDHAVCELEGMCPLETTTVSGNQQAIMCIDGFVTVVGEEGETKYPCDGVNLLAQLDLFALGSCHYISRRIGSDDDDDENVDTIPDIPNGCAGNDIWGWIDPLNGKQYALAGMSDGMAIIDVTTPTDPLVLAWMPTEINTYRIWRDIKVVGHYMYVVCDGNGHGLQYYDLRQIRSFDVAAIKRSGQPMQIAPDGVYREIGNCHNMVVNEAQGGGAVGFAVGTSTCSGGLHMVDLQHGVPQYIGCFSSDGYTHDAECVHYHGQDARYVGHDICFDYNENSLTVVDVSEPSAPVMLSRNPYTGSRYTHQGWANENHDYLVLNDELDEVFGTINSGGKARSYFWNIQNLEEPYILGYYDNVPIGIDHNLYLRGDFAYLSNYETGLQILDISAVNNDPTSAGSVEAVNTVGYFDTYPESDLLEFRGAFSTYAYFENANDGTSFVVLQDINRGFFVLDVSEIVQ